MTTKHNSACLEKAGDDEPIFVLRGQDICAPDTIRAWAEYAKLHGGSPEKIERARREADEMEDWQREHGCKAPD